jgi:hypothetical protein
MSEAQESAQTSDVPIQKMLIDIPTGRSDEVLAFVEKLWEEEAEVAGYAAGMNTKSGAGFTCPCNFTNQGKDFSAADSYRH